MMHFMFNGWRLIPSCLFLYVCACVCECKLLSVNVNPRHISIKIDNEKLSRLFLHMIGGLWMSKSLILFEDKIEIKD